MDRSTAPPACEIRLGVTGHRNLKDPGAVARSVDVLLDEVEEVLAGELGRPVTWRVISPLARGADRIVAGAVLDRPGARLEAVLPLPVDEYRKDFRTASDREEFERLLARAESRECTFSPEVAVEGSINPADLELRRAAYLRCGQRVVDGSQLVIAVWNGRPAPSKGGTGDVVEYAVRQGRLVLVIDADDPARRPQSLLNTTATGEQNAEQRRATTSPSQPELSRAVSRLAAFYG